MNHRLRVVLTTLGMALCVLLMLFLMSTYRGVEYGSVEYVKSNNADLWVLQEHATNILRTTSIIPMSAANKIGDIEGVENVYPVVFLLASVKTLKGQASLYLTGFDPSTGIGGPPKITVGRNLEKKGEIVLDASFAAKYGLQPGDILPVKKDTLIVTGICEGTNMFVIQYAFISLNQLWSIMNFSNIVSCFQVFKEPEADLLGIAEEIELTVPDVVVYDQETFLSNNRNEMKSGLLPLLFMVAVISAIVLTAILSLILSVNIIEQREDYAVMKALGSPGLYTHGLICIQSLLLSISGLIFGALLYFPVVKIVERISPEVSTLTGAGHFLIAGMGILVISFISAMIPARKIAHIYPVEAFESL